MATEKQIEDKLEQTVHTAEAVAARIQANPGAKIVSIDPEMDGNQRKDSSVSADEPDPDDGQPVDLNLNYGTCRYCGQIRQVDDVATCAEANEQATLHCDCREAMEYREEVRRQERRRRALEDADTNLLDLFGKAVKESEAMDLLREIPPLIYDGMLLSVSVKINWTVSAKLSRNSKGNIVIERKDSEAQKVEI